MFALAALAACPPPQDGTGPRPGGGATSIEPDSCGPIDTTAAGRKLYAFLKASAELDRASLALETSVRDACRRMATELGISPEGDTRTVCLAAAKELDANLEVSVRTEKQLVTRYTPPECTTELDLAAGIVAECEATVAADVQVTCEGRCSGTCSGACDGTCAGSTGAGGACEGTCEGTCRGRCSGGCDGYVDVQASAECEVSAELQASLRTECTEPRVEVVEEDVTIVDATKFDRAMKAIDAGLPTILRVGAKAEVVAKAVVQWAKTLGNLVKASAELVGDLGERGLCVAAQLGAAFAAVAQVEARIDVSIEVSASITASAGATAN